MSDSFFKTAVVSNQHYQNFKLAQIAAQQQVANELANAQLAVEVDQFKLQAEERARREANNRAAEHLADLSVDTDRLGRALEQGLPEPYVAYRARRLLRFAHSIDSGTLTGTDDKIRLRELRDRLEAHAAALPGQTFERFEQRDRITREAYDLFTAAQRARLLAQVDLERLEEEGHPGAWRDAAAEWAAAVRHARFFFCMPTGAGRAAGPVAAAARAKADSIGLSGRLQAWADSRYGNNDLPVDLDALVSAVAADRRRFGDGSPREWERRAADVVAEMQQLGRTLIGPAFGLTPLPVSVEEATPPSLEAIDALRKRHLADALAGVGPVKRSALFMDWLTVGSMALVVVALGWLAWRGVERKWDARAAEKARLERVAVEDGKRRFAEQQAARAQADARLAAERQAVREERDGRVAQKEAARAATAEKRASEAVLRELRDFARVHAEAYGRARLAQLLDYSSAPAPARLESAFAQVRSEFAAAGYAALMGAGDFTGWATDVCGLTSAMRLDRRWEGLLAGEAQADDGLAVAAHWIGQLKRGGARPALVDVTTPASPAELAPGWTGTVAAARAAFSKSGETHLLAHLKKEAAEGVARELRRKPTPLDSEIIERVTTRLSRDRGVRNLLQQQPGLSVRQEVEAALLAAKRS